MSASVPITFRTGAARHWATVLATARGYAKSRNAYLIEIVRIPIWPLFLFATTRVTYSVAHRTTVDGVAVSSFLLVGMFGMITWGSTIWSSGYAVENERYEGTVAALFLSPASRAAVIAGYGLGSFVWLLPSFAVVTLLGVATGARLDVADPLALVIAGLLLLGVSLATGFAFAGLFVLSRRANVLANFLQAPVYLLAGFQVPRQSLPPWLQPFSDAIPAGHAVDAVRASALHGATLHEIARPVAFALGTAVVYVLVGLLSLRRVEYAAKRSGQLDLY
jgi:ABC-type multidrug transport system permease subunit